MRRWLKGVNCGVIDWPLRLVGIRRRPSTYRTRNPPARSAAVPRPELSRRCIVWRHVSVDDDEPSLYGSVYKRGPAPRARTLGRLAKARCASTGIC